MDMAKTQYEAQKRLLEQIKALADENRLEILYWLDQGERNVSTLAETLDLSEPTVSHHLAKLREVGFISLRAVGTQRIYRLDNMALARFKKAVQSVEKFPPMIAPKSDDSWLDTLPASFNEQDRAQLREMTFNGKLEQLPNLRHKRYKVTLVMRWLASMFAHDTQYTEKEVNTILKTAHEDFASLRRYMVDMGYLQRSRDGAQYWRAPEDEIKIDYRDRNNDSTED